jgi:hypothetical protein
VKTSKEIELQDKGTGHKSPCPSITPKEGWTMLTRRYFNEIALMLKHTFQSHENHIVYDECPVYPTIVHHINSFFWHDNPNYDTDRFLQASGYDEYAAKIANKDPRGQLEHTLTVLVRALHSLVKSPERMCVPLSLLTPNDGVIFLGYIDEAANQHEPCSNYYDCNGECLAWLEEKDDVIVVRSFGCKFYFQVFSR